MRALFVLALALALPAHGGLPPVKIEKINDRLYALLGPAEFPNKANQGYISNSTLIIGDKGAILVDSGSTDEVGKHLARAIATLTPKPVTHIINTHVHGDHTMGNIAFPNAEVMTSEKCRARLPQESAEWLELLHQQTGMRFPNTKPVLAKTIYRENTRTEIKIHGVRLLLWAPPGSHTDGDMLVYLPDDKVLIGGDVIVHRIMPVYRDAHVKSWVGTLAEAQKLDIKTIVPGHGPLMTKPDLAHLQKMMATLYAGVEAGYKKGLSDSEVRRTLDLTEWKKLSHFDEMMGNNISRAYLEVEAANF